MGIHVIAFQLNKEYTVDLVAFSSSIHTLTLPAEFIGFNIRGTRLTTNTANILTPRKISRHMV